MSENLGSVLERAARLFSDRGAVVDGDKRWSYAELYRHVAAFDAGLDELGLAAGDVVAVLALNSAEHLLAWLGVPRSGRVLNDLNYRLAPAELEFILRDSAARVLMVDDAFLELGRALAAAIPSIGHVIYMGAGAAPDESVALRDLLDGSGRDPAPVAPDSLAGIFYTGGTTGRPKGAKLSHRNLVVNAKHALICLGYTADDSYLHAPPMFHLADGASTYALTWVGGCHVFIPSFDPALWLRTVATERVTRALLVPTMVNMVINHPEITDHDLSSLQGLLYGASPMPLEVLQAAMARFPCDWYQAYGMTEAAPIVSCLTPEDHRRGAAGEEPFAASLRSAGKPVVGVEVEIRRSDGSRAAIGEPGEIWLRGPNVMSGYWNRPEETAGVLDADGWYHSGDAAFQDEAGYLFIVDRVKDMIVSGGENVYSIEVENALHEHAGVLECAVFGVPDPRWGERVHAAVCVKPGITVTSEELIDHCRRLIAGYKIPRTIDLHTQPLPKSGAGKLLKRELRAPFWEGRERQVS